MLLLCSVHSINVCCIISSAMLHIPFLLNSESTYQVFFLTACIWRGKKRNFWQRVVCNSLFQPSIMVFVFHSILQHYLVTLSHIWLMTRSKNSKHRKKNWSCYNTYKIPMTSISISYRLSNHCFSIIWMMELYPLSTTGDNSLFRRIQMSPNSPTWKHC